MQQADRDFGKLSERQTLPILSEFFKETIDYDRERYAIMDFHSEGAYYEVKARKCYFRSYKDTMIGLNKIEFCRTSTKPCYLCFKFYDGIYYWKYEADKEDQLRFDEGGRNDRGFNEIKPYAYVICRYLIKIC